jgi:hypothetical protein
MARPEDYDRISFNCLACKRPGIISAVWANMTHIKLEGTCLKCGYVALVAYERLYIEYMATETIDCVTH